MGLASLSVYHKACLFLSFILNLLIWPAKLQAASRSQHCKKYQGAVGPLYTIIVSVNLGHLLKGEKRSIALTTDETMEASSVGSETENHLELTVYFWTSSGLEIVTEKKNIQKQL